MTSFVQVLNELKVSLVDGKVYFNVVRHSRDVFMTDRYVTRKIAMSEITELRTYTTVEFCTAVGFDGVELSAIVKKRDPEETLNYVQVVGVRNRMGKDPLYYIVSPDTYI